MAPRRRPWGSVVDPVPVGYSVARASKQQFDEIATRAGISSAELFELVVAHMELTADGLPVWWTPPKGEELPITPD